MPILGITLQPELLSGSLSKFPKTMRKTILEIATEKKYLVQEAPIKLTLLQNFEEIWLTNAISGIKWVAQIGQNTSLQSPHHAQIFIESLNKF